MASRALVAEAALVEVFRSMTVNACLCDAFIGARHVALLARHGDMEPHERKVGEVVIECHVGTPTGSGVALSAIDSQFSSVYIVRAMTGEATGVERLIGNYSGVAGVAIDLL